MKWWITIGIIAVIAITGYIILNTSIANKLVIKVLFSNKRYAKNIEVKTYILTQEQVSDLFKYPDKEPVQLTINKLNNINIIYFVARVKNLGKKHAWGLLNFNIPNVGMPIKVSVINVKKQYYCDYVTCLTSIAMYQENKNSAPLISYKWSELYTK